jgi:hypothetical protein
VLSERTKIGSTTMLLSERAKIGLTMRFFKCFHLVKLCEQHCHMVVSFVLEE